MPATPRQLWSLRIAFAVIIVGAILVLKSGRTPQLKALGVCSAMFATAVIFVALRQAPRD